MNEIIWCLKQKKGLKVIESNERVALGYLKMSEDALGTMTREKGKNTVSSISAGYYSIYYAFYAVMQKIGIKSEIHSCSIAFMKHFLKEFYSNEELDLIEIAFSSRNILQYYVDKSVNQGDLEKVWKEAYGFFVKSREILFKLNEKEINKIRKEVNKIFGLIK